MESKYIEWIPIFGKRIMWKRTLQDCPKLAKKLKLKFRLSNDKEKIGKITGNYKRYHIEIDMEKQRIDMNLKNDFKVLALWTGKSYERLTSKDFKFQNKKLNRIFKKRQISENLQDDISSNTKLEALLLNFFKKYGRRISGMQFNRQNYFIFVYKGRGFSDKHLSYGSRGSSGRDFYYIPIEFLETVIPDIIDILKVFDKIGQN